MKFKAAAVGAVLVMLAMAYLWHEAQLADAEARLASVQSELTVEQAAVAELSGLTARQQLSLEQSRQQLEQMLEARNAAEARARAIEVAHASAIQTLQELQKQDKELADWSAEPVPAAADDWLRQLYSPDPGGGGAGAGASGATTPTPDATD